jgi:hypothetical protein
LRLGTENKLTREGEKVTKLCAAQLKHGNCGGLSASKKGRKIIMQIMKRTYGRVVVK